MDNPLSDLELEILDRLYHADRRILSQADMLTPIGLRINEYRSALKVLISSSLVDAENHRYHLSDPGAIAYLTEIRRRSDLSASQEKISALTSSLSAAESALVETNARLSATESRAARSDKKARLYFWASIVATVVCTLLGYLMGKYL